MNIFIYIIISVALLSGCNQRDKANKESTPIEEDTYAPTDVISFMNTELFKKNNHYFIKVCLGSLDHGYYEYFSSKSGRLLSPVLTNKKMYGDDKLKLINCDLTHPQTYKNLNDLLKFIPTINNPNK